MSVPTARGLVARLLVACLALLTACSTAPPESLAFEDDVASRRTVIRIAATSADGLSDAVAAWEREHPTADVIIDVRDPDEHHVLMLEARAPGSAPDIVMIDAEYVDRFRDRTDVLADLSPFGAESAADTMVGWRWEQGVSEDGSILAVPISTGGLALAFRSDLLAQNLTRELEDATTWCELIDIGDRYSDHTGKAFLPEADGLFQAALGQAPIRFHNADGRLIHSTNPAVRDAWDLTMRALGERPQFEDPCPDHTDILRFSANLSAGSADWDDGLQRGRFAATFVSSSDLVRLQTTAPDTSGEWRLTGLPANQAGNVGGAHLAVHADSAHPALAFDLISFIAAPATQLDTFRSGGEFPAARSVYPSPDLLDHRNPFFGDTPVAEVFRSSVRNYVEPPKGPEHDLILEEYLAAVSRVESGTQTPEEAWSEAQWRIDLFLR